VVTTIEPPKGLIDLARSCLLAANVRGGVDRKGVGGRLSAACW
jgi:hypothetical protein